MAHLRELPGAEPCSLRAAVDQKTEIVSRMLAIGFGGITKATNEADEIDCHAPPAAYVSFLQTHDLVGNDLLGQRIYAKAPVHAVRALSAIYLLVPQIPMLFMGDEWGASTPFPFFCDFDGDTGQQAREGRLKFLRKNLQVEERELVRVPDPLAELSFRSAHLDWNELSLREHAEWLRWYRDILKIRREQIVPLAKTFREQCGTCELRSRRVFAATWNLEHNARLILQANLCEIPAHFDSDAGRVLWIEGTEMGPGQLGPWTVRWSVESFGDPHR
jgi:maltooligosyltrehalose trehalohydrolase